MTFKEKRGFLKVQKQLSYNGSNTCPIIEMEQPIWSEFLDNLDPEAQYLEPLNLFSAASWPWWCQNSPGTCTSVIKALQVRALLLLRKGKIMQIWCRQAMWQAANTWHDSQARPSFSYFPSGGSAGTSDCVYQIGMACKSISHLQSLWSSGALGGKSFPTGLC